jgi:hypothetical protein
MGIVLGMDGWMDGWMGGTTDGDPARLTLSLEFQ